MKYLTLTLALLVAGCSTANEPKLWEQVSYNEYIFNGNVLKNNIQSPSTNVYLKKLGDNSRTFSIYVVDDSFYSKQSFSSVNTISNGISGIFDVYGSAKIQTSPKLIISQTFKYNCSVKGNPIDDFYFKVYNKDRIHIYTFSGNDIVNVLQEMGCY